MVDIQSKEVIDKISDELKIQPALNIPRVLGKDIQLVYGVNPQKNNTVLFSTVRAASASNFVLFTVDSNKDTFLTGLNFTVDSDVVADNTTYHVELTVANGAEFRIFQFFKTTTTAIRDQIVLNFNHPIKLFRGSTIQLTNVFTVGVGSAVVTGFGYTTDPQ